MLSWLAIQMAIVIRVASHTYVDMSNQKDGEEVAKTTFRMPKSLLKEVKHFATDNDTTDTDIFNAALREYLDARPKKTVRRIGN